MNVHELVYKTGMRLRNSKIQSCYVQLKSSEHWSIDDLKSNQLRKLQALLNHAYANSEYYRNKFDSSGFSPDQLDTLEDLQLVPMSTKDEVLTNAELIQVKPSGNDEALFYSETSGSTGKPLVFYRNKEWDAWHNASVLRGLSWHGVLPWERNGYLWGYNIALKKRLKIKILDLLQNRFRLFSYKKKDVELFTQELESAKYLTGYSSMIYEVSKSINSSNSAHKYNLKLLKGTSEKIYESYQIEAQKAFGKRIVSEYGSAEGGIIAFECLYGNMHINMETVIVEEVDNEICLTNLVSTSFPIVRYKLGDYIEIDYQVKCQCGMAHPVIKEVTGRVGSLIYGKKHSYPSLSLYYVFKNMAMDHKLIINYQVVQTVRGSIDVRCESALTPFCELLMLKEFNKYFDDDLDIVIAYGVSRDDYSKKKRDFIPMSIDLN
jgi:phenylacetate-CoA ligase